MRDFDEESITNPYIVALASNGGWFVAHENSKRTLVWKFVYFHNKVGIQIWNRDKEHCIIVSSSYLIPKPYGDRELVVKH